MRVIDCNECGETLSAADDRELAEALGAHMRDEHDTAMSDEELEAQLSEEAYDATDS